MTSTIFNSLTIGQEFYAPDFLNLARVVKYKVVQNPKGRLCGRRIPKDLKNIDTEELVGSVWNFLPSATVSIER